MKSRNISLFELEDKVDFSVQVIIKGMTHDMTRLLINLYSESYNIIHFWSHLKVLGLSKLDLQNGNEIWNSWS